MVRWVKNETIVGTSKEKIISSQVNQALNNILKLLLMGIYIYNFIS